MSPVLSVRKRLGLTQSELAGHLGVSQGNVSFYEKGQTLPPGMAGKLIELAKASGLALTYDHLYGAAPLDELIGPAGAPPAPSDQQLVARDAA